MRRYLRQLEQATFKIAFEKATKPIIDEAINSNLDHNSAVKRILKVIHQIPGSSLAANVLFSAGGEFLAEHADELWPGDDRPYTRALRGILRQAGPLIVGAADATADALNTLAETAADQVISNPSQVAGVSGTATMDAIYFFIREGKRYLVIPLRNPATGKIVLDELGDPIPTNAEVHEVYNHDDYIKPVMRTEKGGKDGQQTKQVKGPPAKKRTLIGPLTPLQAAEQNLFDLSRFPIEEAEEIKKLLRPKPSWESLISPDVDRVLSWLIDVLSLLALGLNALERQEIEDLVQKMKSQKPEPEWVNRRLGRFRVETDKFPLNKGRVYNDAQLAQIRTLLSRIRDEIDITLEGEQSLTTKARKGLEAAPDVLRQVRELLSSSTPWVMAGARWWLYALIVGLILLILGIILPTTGIPIFGPAFLVLCAVGAFYWGFRPLGVWLVVGGLLILALAALLEEDSWQIALYCSVIGGVVGFAFTWPFPAIQQVLDLLRSLPGFKNLSDEGFKDLGRRIALFSLTLAGLLVPFNWFQSDPIARVMITAVVLAGIGRLFGFTLIGRTSLSDEEVIRALKAYNWLITLPMTATIVLVTFLSKVKDSNEKMPDHAMTGPEFIQWVHDHGVHIGTWFGGLTMWHWLGIGALVVFALILGVILFGKSKEGSGGGDRAITLASILGGFALIAALCGLGLVGLDKIGSWFDDPAPVAQPTVVVQQPKEDNGPWFDRTKLCANPNTTFEQKQILNCP